MRDRHDDQDSIADTQLPRLGGCRYTSSISHFIDIWAKGDRRLREGALDTC